MNIKKTLSEMWANVPDAWSYDIESRDDFKKLYTQDFKKHDWIVETKEYVSSHHETKRKKSVPKGHITVRVRGAKIPEGLKVFECAQYDGTADLKRMHIVVRKDVVVYLDKHKIYTYATASGLAMSEKDLAVLLLKFK